MPSFLIVAPSSNKGLVLSPRSPTMSDTSIRPVGLTLDLRLLGIGFSYV